MPASAARGSLRVMRIATGKVVSGKVVVEGEPLEEGATVTVLAPEGGESFRVTPEQEAELLAALEESETSLIDGATLLRELGSRS